jgi:hypothetical protein
MEKQKKIAKKIMSGCLLLLVPLCTVLCPPSYLLGFMTQTLSYKEKKEKKSAAAGHLWFLFGQRSFTFHEVEKS